MSRETNRVVDVESLQHHLGYADADLSAPKDGYPEFEASFRHARRKPPKLTTLDGPSRWPDHDEDVENAVPASLLVEDNERLPGQLSDPMESHDPSIPNPETVHRQGKAPWENSTAQHVSHGDYRRGLEWSQPKSLLRSHVPGGRREKALWRWVNISNLDSCMRDVYDYFEGGGLLCILCSNALWLL